MSAHFSRRANKERLQSPLTESPATVAEAVQKVVRSALLRDCDDVAQAHLAWLDALRKIEQSSKSLRDYLVDQLLMGMPIEPGPLDACLQTSHARILSYPALTRLLGESEVSWIRENLPTTIRRQLNIKKRNT